MLRIKSCFPSLPRSLSLDILQTDIRQLIDANINFKINKQYKPTHKNAQ